MILSVAAGSTQHKQMACWLDQHPTTACSGRIQNRFPATNSAQRYLLQAQTACPAERKKMRKEGNTGNGYGRIFFRKCWNLFLLLYTKGHFSSKCPVIINRVFLWVEMSEEWKERKVNSWEGYKTWIQAKNWCFAPATRFSLGGTGELWIITSSSVINHSKLLHFSIFIHYCFHQDTL